MNTTNNLIRRSFNKAADTYDDYATIQRTVCLEVMKQLSILQTTFGQVLDLGCGTGVSTQQLFDHLSVTHCDAVDFADRLLVRAQTKLSHFPITWHLMDFEYIEPMQHDYDLIFSNMSLQWATNFAASLSHWVQLLKSNGLFVFTLPLSNNFPEIKAEYKPVFLSHQMIRDLLHKHSMQMAQAYIKSITIGFDNTLELLRYLKHTGTNHYKNKKTKGLARIPYSDIFHDSNTTTLTYKIGFYIARLP